MWGREGSEPEFGYHKYKGELIPQDLCRQFILEFRPPTPRRWWEVLMGELEDFPRRVYRCRKHGDTLDNCPDIIAWRESLR